MYVCVGGRAHGYAEGWMWVGDQSVYLSHVPHVFIIIIIIIAIKGAIEDFLQSPHWAASCLQHARSSDWGAIM